MPVKNKLDVLTKKLTASNSENNQCIISAKGSTSNNTISQAKTTKELSGIALPKTSDILSSQLTIAIEVNDAPLSSAQEPGDIKSEVTQLLSIATNNSRSSTEIVDANSVVVAVLASPLQAGKASSRTNNSENQPTNLFVDNGKIVEEQNLSHSKEIIEIKSTKSTDPQRDLSIKHNFEGVENSQLLECIVNDTTQLEAESINTDLVSTDLKGFEQQRALKAKQHYLPQLIDEKQIDEKMPELQVSPTPVKPVQAFAENSADKISISKKKTVVRRIARKVSVDKSLEKTKAEESQLEETAVGKENKENERLIIEDKQTGVVVNKASQNSTFCNEVSTEKESSPGASAIAPPLEKPRKVKKKVIIKRQHRKLSVGENSFFKEAEVVQGATETLEKAIAYVTDDEEDNKAQIAEVCHPIKSCMKSREFQVGDWVMYGERFRKTQIRWKKGQISERITSISYKIKIDDKEVSAHISYIKKYTGRKVNFGGKEYLEIDYEQLAEEERQARSYSIWNMV
ncbi:unnamed protein product [Ceratitis capitata]|uniref:(Mediterranean fruit fly) hypothetical protein n=2 Tax=Ceratitis capitata TaxID=7213 RepID=A0A811V3T3_CERCA|nr:unnamed protein product [Ceratitis capitata]